MAQTMNVKILQVTKTTAEWASVNDVISKGLLLVELTADGKTKIKVGNGVDTFADLKYIESATDTSLYYTKNETDTQISEAIKAIGDMLVIKGVLDSKDALPASDNKVGDVYLVKPADGDNAQSANDSYEEYIWTSADAWEFMGHAQQTDLTEYAKTTEVEALVNAVDNKVTTLTATVTENKNACDTATKQVADDLTALTETVANNKKAAEDALAPVSTKADANETAITELTKTVEGNKTVAETAIADVDKKADKNATDIATNTASIAANAQALTDYKAEVEGAYVKYADELVLNCTL